MFGNIGKMMKMVGKLKTELPAMQERIANSEHTAEAGNGAVTATVSGKLDLVDLKIDRAALPEGELDMTALADFVKAAISSAQFQAAEAAREAMLELTEGEELPPGFGGMM